MYTCVISCQSNIEAYEGLDSLVFVTTGKYSYSNFEYNDQTTNVRVIEPEKLCVWTILSHENLKKAVCRGPEPALIYLKNIYI